jgi:primary-amine oxidase
MRLVLPIFFMAGAALCQTAAPAPNPLAPLSADEIRSAARIFRGDQRMPRAGRFTTLSLHEPPKDAVLGGRAAPRQAFAVVYDYQRNQTFEGVADLAGRRIESWREIRGAEPPLMGEDSARAEQVMRADPRFREAMAERGIADLENVYIMSWSAGYFALPGTERDRIVRSVCAYGGAGANLYAHPIEGVSAHVDVTRRTILDFTDIDRDVPVSRENFELARPASGYRPAPAALHITQPEGPGFRVENGEVRWEKWRFRYALDSREGLVLYTVGFEDAGRVRSILYRASLSEMVVPYGDPGAAWYFRNSFDAGELGLGSNASPLHPGADCPQNCTVLDATLADESGAPETIHGAVALYERDSGIAWKHGENTRRARDLVIGYLTQVGNYEYGFDWIFHQDGTLECRVALTGIMAIKGVKDGAHDPSAHLVAKNLAAPHHQHFFNFRLDFDVDGAANRVVEVNNQPAPEGDRNPYGNAFTMRETPLTQESAAQRNLDLRTSRRWLIENPSSTNALGHSTGYALVPGENAMPYALPESWLRKRAGFLNAHVWVTPYKAEERYAAGDYPNQSHGGDGLPKWTSANRPIDNRDVVVWYTMGITHIPRPEDWPVMPVQYVGFQLMPWGFFSQNPVMDLPPPH